MAVERGDILRLIVIEPPRHGKSETTTVKFPSWYLGRNPDRRVIITSHTASLAARFSMRARNDFHQFGPEVWGLEVNPDVSAMYRWDVLDKETSSGQPPGGMIAAGIGGPITGQGGHLAIIDDPVKDAEGAHSLVQREAVWDWYRYVLRTRLQPGAAVILVLTRWHEDDLAGRLIEAAKVDPEADQWTVLHMDALCESDNDILGRSLGEALWPEQYDVAALKAIRASVGSYVWSALYQGRPSPAEGGIFKRWWWRFWKPAGIKLPPVTLRGPDGEPISVEALPLPDKLDEKVQSWDMAFKDTKASAFVVGQVWGKRGADKFLLDQDREKRDFVSTIAAVQAVTERWPDAKAKWIEDKANGPAVISTLKSKISGLIAIEPYGTKEARAFAVSPEVEAGNVYLPHPAIAPWVWDFIEECTAFPNATYADQVDTMTQALNKFSGRRGARALGRKPAGL